MIITVSMEIPGGCWNTTGLSSSFGRIRVHVSLATVLLGINAHHCISFTIISLLLSGNWSDKKIHISIISHRHSDVNGCVRRFYLKNTGMAGLASAWAMARRKPKEYRHKVDAATRCSDVWPHTWPDLWNADGALSITHPFPLLIRGRRLWCLPIQYYGKDFLESDSTHEKTPTTG